MKKIFIAILFFISSFCAFSETNPIKQIFSNFIHSGDKIELIEIDRKNGKTWETYYPKNSLLEYSFYDNELIYIIVGNKQIDVYGYDGKSDTKTRMYNISTNESFDLIISQIQ